MHSTDPLPASAIRHRYEADSLETASGAKIVTLCFDRLDRDLATALVTMEAKDHYGTNAALGHAQALVGELVGMLDVASWDHATELLSVYDYLLRLLAVANASKAPMLVREGQRLVSEIGNAFREAAVRIQTASPSGGPAPRTAPGSDIADGPQRLSLRA